MITPEYAPSAPQLSLKGRLRGWLSARSPLQRWLLGAAAWVLLIALGYAEEDWRGRWVWEHYKQQSNAHGINLDWAANIPAPVPDDENFFKAPHMQQWFVGRGGNGFSARLGYCPSALKPEDAVAKVTFKPANAAVSAGEADVILRFDHGRLTLSSALEGQAPNAEESKIIPLVVMDEVPITDVIKNLAKQAGINFVLGAGVQFGSAGDPEPIISGRWSNVTAEQLLVDLLRDYNLRMLMDAQTRIARITKKNPAAPVGPVNSAAAAALGDLIKIAYDAATNATGGVRLTAALGFQLTAARFGPIEPVRVVVLSDTTPDAEEIKGFFPKNPLGNGYGPMGSQPQVQPDDDTNLFHVFLSPGPWVSAADYLAWSDPLQPEFNEIREALKRPYARMDGDYDHPEAIPIPNFVCVRMLAQMLAQRAQSYLLLNQPEQALRELTLLHDMCRLMEARPGGRPMTLVAAMINVAVTGLYVSVIADGMQLHFWREPDLAAIQEQLAQIDLEPYVAEAFKFEPASHAHLVETTTSTELAKMFTQSYQRTTQTTTFEDLKDPTYWFCLLAPRGWIYQNIANAGRLEQNWSDGFDPANHLVLPKKAEAGARKVDRALKRLTPFNFLARMMVPNFSRATQTFAKNQTLVNEAYLVCALERCRLAHGHYPETLNDLTPQFAEKLPADLIGGEPLKYRLEGEKFTLYSIGWNETDDGGIHSFTRDGSGDLAKNDWVWPY